MIKFLAETFRKLHYVVGTSEFPPGISDRTIVFAGLGIIMFIGALGVILFRYIIPLLYVPQ